MKKIIFAALVAAFLAGCSSTPTTAPVEDKSSSTDPAATASTGASTSGTSTAGIGGTATGANPLKDPNNILSKRSIYFEFDSFAVSEQYKPIIEAQQQRIGDADLLDLKPALLSIDNGSTRARRIFRKLLAAEAAEAQ